MALHDSDPSTTNRIDPTPQASDSISERYADGTTAITNKQGSSSGARVSTKDGSIKVNNGTIDVINLGLQTNGTYAFKFSDSSVPRLLMSADSMKISQPGVDVTTATNSQLIFNSSQNMFKIVASGTATIPGSTTASTNSQDTVTVAHNLGFNPIVIAFAIDPITGNYTQLPMSTDVRALQRNTASPNNGFTVEFIDWIWSSTSTTNVQFYRFYANLNYNGAGATYTTTALNVKYYLLQETAN